MSLWLVRGDKGGLLNDQALEDGFCYVGFQAVPDLSGAKTKKAVMDLVRKGYPDDNRYKITNYAAQLFAFAHRIETNDIVAMPLRKRSQIALGRAKGPYQYRSDLGDHHHTRPVEWVRPDVPRMEFDQDLLHSLGAFMTVCQIKRNNAEKRVEAMLKGGKDGPTPPPPPPPVTDIEQAAKDQILEFIKRNFKGHDLARLVDCVLQADGYETHLSPPGPDGGVDILAGRGSLGLDGPRLCVQVKSSQSPADVNVFRGLQGTMSTFKADQGLLVSWGGFTQAVEKEARLSFFSVRLWNSESLVDAVFRNYDRLPEEQQSELPLKRIWALVLEE